MAEMTNPTTWQAIGQTVSIHCFVTFSGGMARINTVVTPFANLQKEFADYFHLRHAPELTHLCLPKMTQAVCS